jgi:LysM repeat protein
MRTTRAAAAAMASIAVAACSAPSASTGARFTPPPPLALVAVVDPTPEDAAGELRQLAAVLRAGVMPSQALVVSLLAATPLAATYAVRSGDSLSSIASGQGVPLAALQDANPQLGPLAGRDWNRVYPGDRVTVPAVQGTPAARNPIVTRAPAGPPPPVLVRMPIRPGNPTTFQDAQFRRAVASAEATNRQRVAAWRAEVAKRLEPWLNDVLAQLDRLASSMAAAPPPAMDPAAVAASIEAAANTLHGLPGRRVLLVLAGARLGMAAGLPPGVSLQGVHLVVANMPAPAGAPFTTAAAAAGATVTALDPALTELQLPEVVNGD